MLHLNKTHLLYIPRVGPVTGLEPPTPVSGTVVQVCIRNGGQKYTFSCPIAPLTLVAYKHACTGLCRVLVGTEMHHGKCPVEP